MAGSKTAPGLALLRPAASDEGGDRDLRDAVAAGDVEAVYRRYGARVSRWAARLAGPGLDLEDIVHDVFLVVLRRLNEFRWDARLSTWLHEITIHVVQAHRRKRRLRAWLWPFGRAGGAAADGEAAPVGGRALARADGRNLEEQLADERLSPLESAERRQAAALLYHFLDQLSEKYRTAVVLFELEGLPCQEIASLTGTSVANVWARVSRGREQLIQAFATWESGAGAGGPPTSRPASRRTKGRVE
ncbi:MAG TPA: sigma-70 family RNA polymerase sigma factor [Polyangia bacterium]